MVHVSTYFTIFVRDGSERAYLCLYQSVPGRPSTMVAADEVSALVARVQPRATVVFTGNLQALQSRRDGAGDACDCVETVHAGLAKEIRGRSASFFAVHDGGGGAPVDACEGLLATMREAATAGRPVSVDELLSRAGRYVTESGGRVSAAVPRPMGDVQAARPASSRETLPDFIRSDLFSPDPGSRMDAVLELGAAAAADSTRARELLADLARHDRAVEVRALAESYLRGSKRRHRPRSVSPAPELARAARATVPWPEFTEVPASSYELGVGEPLGQPFERRRGPSRLPRFALALTPVTNRDYLSFALDEDDQADWPDHWTSERVLRGALDAPVVNVSWYDGMSYCRWLTARAQAAGLLSPDCHVTLPSEAEWEFVARNGSTDLHPWGNAFDAARCNVRSSGHLRVLPVGTFSPAGDSVAGCVDLIGNVWEWTRSLWGRGGRAPDYHYPYTAGDGRESPEADGAIRRVIRGGAFYYEDACSNSYTRNRAFPDARHPGGGFRIALAS